MTQPIDEAELLKRYAISAYLSDPYWDDKRGKIVNHFKRDLAAYTAQAVTAALKRIPEPTMADVFPVNPANNPDSYDDMVNVVRWYKRAITNELSKWKGAE